MPGGPNAAATLLATVRAYAASGRVIRKVVLNSDFARKSAKALLMWALNGYAVGSGPWARGQERCSAVPLDFATDMLPGGPGRAI